MNIKNKKFIYLLGTLIAVVPYFLFSCKPEEDMILPSDPTSLTIEVSNEYLDLNEGVMGGIVEGAKVYLYESDSDRLNEVNSVDWGTTRSNGKVTFSNNLKPIEYYFDVSFNDQTNWDTRNSTGGPLVTNAANNAMTNIHGRWGGISSSPLLSSAAGKTWKINIRSYPNAMELIDEPKYRYLRNEIFKLFKNGSINASTKGKGEWEMLSRSRLKFNFGSDNFMDLFNISNMTPTTIKAIGKIDSGEDCFINLELIE
jgi:hypothetical protein